MLIALFHMLGWFLHNQLPNFVIDGKSVLTMSMRACGFRLVSQGRTAIENAVLEAIRLHCPPVGAIREFFGSLVLQCRRNADFESYKEVVDLFQGLVERNVPVGPGDMFILPVSQRYLHSLNSAAAEYGMAPKRVRKALEDRKLIPTTNLPGPRVYVSVEDAERVLSGLRDSMTTVEVAKVLGVHENKVRELVDGGLIEPNERGVADSRPFYRFSRNSVDELVTRIFDKLPLTDNDQGLMRLSEVCMRRYVMLTDLLGLIIDRKLTRTFRSDLSCKIGSLLIDLEEVPSLGPVEVQADMVDYSCYKSLAEVERAISTSKITVAALVENGFLSTELKFNPRNGLQQPFVHDDTIAEFQRQYMSLFRVSDGCKWDMPKKRDELKKLGVKPIFEVSGKVTPFYKIQDLRQVSMLP